MSNTSKAPQFSMQQLIEAGVHFGHKTRRWNPRMAPFIYGARNDIHIIDLNKTVPLMHHALAAVQDVCSKNGRVLFVGTKRQAQDPIAEAAKRCGQYYVNFRWLGGLLTNWTTIQKSIKTLRTLDEQLENGNTGFTKKEILQMTRQRAKLESSLGGIKDMGGLPNLIFIIDTNKESLAVAEAKTLGIPVVGIVDTNADYTDITHPIPGNDDSTRAITLYADLVANAALAGLQQAVNRSGQDAGASANPTPAPAKKAEAKKDAEKPAEKKAASKKDDAKKDVVVEKKPSRKKATPKKAEEKAEETAATEEKADKPKAKKATEEKADKKAS